MFPYGVRELFRYSYNGVDSVVVDTNMKQC